MVKHIVMFELKDEFKGKTKEDNIPIVLETLRGLSKIDGVRDLEVHLNNKSDPHSKNIDIVLEALFEDEKALESYKKDPIYQRSIDTVKPLRINRYAVDYTL